MRKCRKLLSLLLAVIMLLITPLSAFAAVSDTGFTDVSSDAWYADAVKYVYDNGIMSGTSSTQFSPDINTSRAMLVTILYRVSGNPNVSFNSNFTDVVNNAWYTNAVAWATENNIVFGYDNGAFGVNDPVTFEEAVTILWRYAGSPDVPAVQQNSYSAKAVEWAIKNNIVSNPFEVTSSATRADIAAILFHYMALKASESQVLKPSEIPENSNIVENDTLVIYFSATGSTKRVAEYIANILNVDTYEITPAQAYTSEDLNWTKSSSRVNAEHKDENSRPAITGELPNLSDYNTVFIGYPIWWGEAPNIVRTFMERVDFSGKTIVPFCTSSSSGLGSSARTLQTFATNANWLEGQRFSSGVDEDNVKEWVLSLDLNANTENIASQKDTKSLVVYFSMPETSNPNNMTTEEDNSTVVINGEVLGNTQYMAQVIQKTINADIFRIEPETPYPTDHKTLVDLASEEQNQNARPKLLKIIDNLDEYDTVFIGYPNWWGDMPMILYTFFEQHDFSGKTIIPFNTHGGSGFSNTINAIRQLEPDAEVIEGLSISRNRIQNAENEIIEWVNDLNL